MRVPLECDNRVRQPYSRGITSCQDISTVLKWGPALKGTALKWDTHCTGIALLSCQDVLTAHKWGPAPKGTALKWDPHCISNDTFSRRLSSMNTRMRVLS